MPERVDCIPQLRKGDPEHVRGFILYKLWMMGCWAREGKHGKHIDLENDLPTNYEKRFKGVVLEQAGELKNANLVHIFPSGTRKAICAVLSEDAIKEGLSFVNPYLESVGEEPLDSSLREIITGKRSEKKKALSREELRKYVRMHRQAER